jgi:hypothetical protein
VVYIYTSCGDWKLALIRVTVANHPRCYYKLCAMPGALYPSKSRYRNMKIRYPFGDPCIDAPAACTRTDSSVKGRGLWHLCVAVPCTAAKRKSRHRVGPVQLRGSDSAAEIEQKDQKNNVDTRRIERLTLRMRIARATNCAKRPQPIGCKAMQNYDF